MIEALIVPMGEGAGISLGALVLLAENPETKKFKIIALFGQGKPQISTMLQCRVICMVIENCHTIALQSIIGAMQAKSWSWNILKRWSSWDRLGCSPKTDDLWSGELWQRSRSTCPARTCKTSAWALWLWAVRSPFLVPRLVRVDPGVTHPGAQHMQPEGAKCLKMFEWIKLRKEKMRRKMVWKCQPGLWKRDLWDRRADLTSAIEIESNRDWPYPTPAHGHYVSLCDKLFIGRVWTLLNHPFPLKALGGLRSAGPKSAN